MNSLIVSTLPVNDDKILKISEALKTRTGSTEIFNAEEFKISGCIGCTNCWLKNPGVCSLKDDYEILFKKFLKSDIIILAAETRLGFLSHKMKNIIDRVLPLGTPYTKLYKGEMRHVGRYDKQWKIGLVYKGYADKEFMNLWLNRFTLNFFSKSLGAYDIENTGGLLNEITNI